MPDKGKQPGDSEEQRINVDQEDEVALWARKLGVTRDRIRKAVQTVGPAVKDVRKYLED